MAKFHKIKVKDVYKETRDCAVIVFEIPEELKNNFHFKQGQHLTLKTFIKGEDTRRSYSLCSSPVDGEWKVAVKTILGGAFSTFINSELRAGDYLEVMEPSGMFGVDIQPEKAKNYLFFAAGSGITPVIALIKAVLFKDTTLPVRLVYSNHTRDSTIFLNELRQLEKMFPSRFMVKYFFSNAQNLLEARLNKGLVAEILNQERFSYGKDTLCYLCGPHSYMQMISITLLTEGVPAGNIRREIFDTIKPVVRVRPPTPGNHTLPTPGVPVSCAVSGNHSFGCQTK